MEETVTMSSKEIERLKVLSLVLEGKSSQVLASKKLGISDRQIRRLLTQMKLIGVKALISKKRGKRSNRSFSIQTKSNILSIVRTNYNDFGPKLAHEYLEKFHQIKISYETLRLWMIENHLWVPKNFKKRKIHPPRERRKAFGELIQIDGSHHHWFEDRADPCVLMVFIDDATSMITSLHFTEGESLRAYYQTLEKHLRAYGIPLAFYGDKCSVLSARITNLNSSTQFQKALKELNCQLIFAQSPQAKGRVERANRTLQDRLVKELRLKNISTIEDANAMLEEFRDNYNKLFSKEPSEQTNAHRSLEGICLERVLCTRETRTLYKDSIVQFNGTFYQISTQDPKLHLYKGKRVDIRIKLDGNITALIDDKEVKMVSLQSVDNLTMTRKEIQLWTPKNRYIPSINHPYKKAYFRNKMETDLLRKIV